MPSSDDDPPSDDDEEHGQSLTKYLKRNKRMPLSADTSSDGSDLLEMEGITPSLPLSVGEKSYYHSNIFFCVFFILLVNLWVILLFSSGGFYTSTQKEPGAIRLNLIRFELN